MNIYNLLVVIFSSWILLSCNTVNLVEERQTQLSQFTTTEYTLSDSLVEISGLELLEDDFIGFNDSGGEAALYILKVDDPKKIKQTIKLTNANNIDWESIALSDDTVYVGDFGNNLGNRKDLNIYYFPLKNVVNDSVINVANKKFSYFYPEQNQFDDHAYNHDYDMEAMVYHNEKLHLFTKEWKSNRTRHYTLDLVKGKQPAWLVEEMNIDFMVTGADVIKINHNYSRLGLVGYTRDGDVYMMLSDFETKENKWFGYPKTLIKLGAAGDVGQVEGITFKSVDEVCYSAEKITFDQITKDQNITCFSLN